MKIIVSYFNRLNFLVRVSQTTHAAHYAQHVVVGGIDTHFSGVISADGVVAEHQLEGGIINSGHVARARWLVFLWAQSERVDVDTSVWGTSVVLVWLHQVEVSSFALREAVLSVELEFGGNHWVLSPAVHVEGGFSKHERTGIRDQTFPVTHRRERSIHWAPAVHPSA